MLDALLKTPSFTDESKVRGVSIAVSPPHRGCLYGLLSSRLLENKHAVMCTQCASVTALAHGCHLCFSMSGLPRRIVKETQRLIAEPGLLLTLMPPVCLLAYLYDLERHQPLQSLASVRLRMKTTCVTSML